MRSLAAVFRDATQRMRLEEVEIPPLQPGETLVRIVACTLCGSDLHTLAGDRIVPTPTILGHEAIGEVVDFGGDVPVFDLSGKSLEIGDRVCWALVANCGDCFYCVRDLPQKCLHSVKYGHEGFQPQHELRGGFSEYCVLVRNAKLLQIPKSLPLEVACPMSCSTATVMCALEELPSIRDGNFAVIGAGMIGLTTCAALRLQGANHVVCVDRQPERARQAERFGASLSLNSELQRPLGVDDLDCFGFDAVIEASGTPDGLRIGIDHVRLGGSVLMIGSVFPTPAIPIHPESIVRRNLRIIGIHNYTPRHLIDALSFLNEACRRFPLADLVPKWFPLSEIEKAVELAQEGSAIRVGIRNVVSLD